MVIERNYINDLRIAWGQGRGRFLSICIQMILPAIWFCVENPNITFCSYWNKDWLASSFHLFHLSLIGIVGIVVCNPSHQKAFYTFLLAMSGFHCVWSNQLFFFLMERIQISSSHPPKERCGFEFYCSSQRLSICVTIFWNVHCQPTLSYEQWCDKVLIHAVITVFNPWFSKQRSEDIQGTVWNH